MLFLGRDNKDATQNPKAQDHGSEDFEGEGDIVGDFLRESFCVLINLDIFWVD